LRSLGAKNVITFKKGNKKRVSASNGDGTRTVIIATKTKNRGTWQTSIDYGNPQNVSFDNFHYWVFVDLSTPTDPQFYVVRERWISHDINKVHKEYLSKHKGVRPNNKKSKHHKITLDRIKQWHERWDLLKIF